jgi:exodeoxyribonuclease-3
MRIITINLNGIRSAANKGFFTWMLKQDADIICMQETKAQEHQITADIFQPEGYHSYFFDAEKKGYSGVALYLRHKPNKIITGLGFDCADKEGRYIQADYDNFSVVSLYLPSGSSGPERQAIKFEFLAHYEKHLKKLSKEKREYIICGDWNIAHTKNDIKNWRGNQKNSGFLPEERAWMDMLFDELGYVDAFRVLNQLPDQYTWWSNRGQAWAKNVGWRIDYQIITPGLKDKLKSVEIYKDERFSDHAPLIIEYENLTTTSN